MLAMLALALFAPLAAASEPCWSPLTDSKSTRCGCGDTTSCAALAASRNCSVLPDCFSILGTDCGWCWDATTTSGQPHGGRKGGIGGPSDGECADWTWFSAECHKHVDCAALPTCSNIMGTYCGWCSDTGVGMKGTESGPGSGSCKDWIWSHGDCSRPDGPQQVRLSLGSSLESNADDVPAWDAAITWSTKSFSESYATVVPSAGGGNTFRINASHSNFTETNSAGFQHIYRVLLRGLSRGERYNYTVTTGDSTRGAFSFVFPRNDSNFAPRLLLFGDMGRHGGGEVLRMLRSDAGVDAIGGGAAATGHVDAVIHVGDFAYDMQSDDGLNGDTFLERIEPISSRIPYMTSPGNHEIQGAEGDPSHFAHYRARFTMPRSFAESGLRMWHSWELGPVHFISYSSEVFFSGSNETQKAQADWLRADLAAANKRRDSVPWVVAYGHRPMYCSNADGDDCTKSGSLTRAGLEDIFHKGGVDLVFEAHEHSYERMWPVYAENVTETYPQTCKDDVGCQGTTTYTDPSSTIHIVSGAAGCNESDGACLNPILKHLGPWSAFYSQAPGTYSYGRLEVLNSTHLKWDNVRAETERVEDSVLVVQRSHGPRV